MPPTFSSFGRRMTGSAITQLMTAALEQPGLKSLAAGFTDNATLPLAEVAEACKQLFSAEDPSILQYGTNQGRPRLREWIAQHIASLDGQTSPCPAEQIAITNGSQQALSLAMQVLCDPGDVVAVELPTYFVFIEMARGLGIELIPLPQDPDGRFNPHSLQQFWQQMRQNGKATRLKAVYLVSYFSNPSGASRTREEKEWLGHSCREAHLNPVIIEDAAYRDLWFGQPWPAPGILALNALDGFSRLYLGTFTKPFATGLKVGYAICDDPELLQRILCAKGHQDFGTGHFAQAVIEKITCEGAFNRHLQTLRATYHSKMQILENTLRQHKLHDKGWHWQTPKGGLYLWLTAPRHLDTGTESPFCRQCLKNGVLYVPGELCMVTQPPHNTIRLSYGVLSESDLIEAANRFAKAIDWPDRATRLSEIFPTGPLRSDTQDVIDYDRGNKHI